PLGAQRRDRFQGIAVRFSRPGELADSVIARMAAREREKALVVSSDAAVLRHARQHNAATMEAGLFEEKVMLAAYLEFKGAPETESSGWTPTTRKKGPRHRLTKRQRRNRRRQAKL
ncbi:MAG: NYN domain-containing protein, partial [Desulfobacterales bacterium]